MNDRQKTTLWAYSAVFLFFSVLLVSLRIWVSFFQMADFEKKVQTETAATESIKTQQLSILKPELKELFQSYSDGIAAVESVLLAREEVFTGVMDEDDYNPVVVLDYVDFFNLFRKILGNRTFINGISISPVGELSFAVQTTSYTNAARQMAVIKYGLQEEQQRKKLAQADTSEGEEEEEELDGEEKELPPPLLVDVIINNVSRNELKGDEEDLPEILRSSDATYDFVVQARINPEYYVYRLEKLRLEEELKAEEEAIEKENELDATAEEKGVPENQ